MAAQALAEFEPTHSPLYMVMHDPTVHQFIGYLAEKKAQQEQSPSSPLHIEISRKLVEQVRESFKSHILGGEFNLHFLTHLLATNLLTKDFELHSNVIGLLPGGDRPFLIRERITRETLFSQTDLDLGNQMLAKFRYHSGGTWVPLELSANFVEYLPGSHPASGVNRITSRVKAEEELWNKVTDELFNFDELVRRDKHLQHMSKFIKDVFGIKIVCEDDNACHRVLERLRTTAAAECDWSVIASLEGKEQLLHSSSANDRLLDFVETKNYLTCDPSKLKRTGWRALKSVVRWQNQVFEIQVQPLSNYYLELDHMSGPSHSSFKLQRDTLRNEVAQRIPLYGFYRDLLRMLFLNISVSFEYANASVVITE